MGTIAVVLPSVSASLTSSQVVSSRQNGGAPAPPEVRIRRPAGRDFGREVTGTNHGDIPGGRSCQEGAAATHDVLGPHCNPSRLCANRVDEQIVAAVPPDQLPEEFPVRARAGDEGVALPDPGLPKRIQATLDKPGPESAPAVRAGDGKVIEVAAAPVVTTETGSHQPAFIEGNEAATGIPAKKRSEVPGAVRGAQAHVFGCLPQVSGAVDVRLGERPDCRLQGSIRRGFGHVRSLIEV